MNRAQVERAQVWVYLAAIGAGVGLGSFVDPARAVAERSIWPGLGVLLYVTFLQVPMTSLRTALRSGRFLVVVLVGNFVLVPLVVWALTTVIPLDQAVLLGVLLVLLVPCTDWYISFTHLSGGDTAAAIAVTPLNLLAQLLLLPVYLWLFLGDTFGEIFVTGRVVTVFMTLIVVPLLAAYLTEQVARRRPRLARVRERSAALPVPLLALVVFLLATSQVEQVTDGIHLLPTLTLVFGSFLIAMVLLGAALAKGVGFRAPSGRAAVLSLVTRNSFVVLPLALALPPRWHIAVVVIVCQSLVELLGLAVLVGLLPRIVPDQER